MCMMKKIKKMVKVSLLSFGTVFVLGACGNNDMEEPVDPDMEEPADPDMEEPAGEEME